MPQQQDPNGWIHRMTTHKYFTNFLLYGFTYFAYGQVCNCIGPLIPYLAAHENRAETQYTGLFAGRALGYFLGPIFLMSIGDKLTYHQIIAAGVTLMAMFAVLFDFSSSIFMKGFCTVGMMFGSSFIDTCINLSVMACFKGENLSNWLQAIFGCFGVGGLLVPFLVYLFQLRSYTILGLFSMISVVFCYLLPTPEIDNNTHTKKQQKQTLTIIKPFPTTLLYMMAFGLIFIAAQQSTYGGWVSSYAVLYGFSTKEHATFYTSIYWISITFFRFALTVVRASPAVKIRNLGIIAIISTFVGYFLIFQVDPSFGLTTLTILYGFTDSILSPTFITVPQQLGYKLGIKQITMLIIISSFSGYLSVLVGKLMEFNYNWLLYSICLMNVFIVISITLITKYFQHDRSADLVQKMMEDKEKLEQIELKQKI